MPDTERKKVPNHRSDVLKGSLPVVSDDFILHKVHSFPVHDECVCVCVRGGGGELRKNTEFAEKKGKNRPPKFQITFQVNWQY